MSSGFTSRSDSPSPAADAILAPGFRFHPTDEELVIYYLKRKVRGLSFRVDAIAEVDIYNCEPWDLPCRSRIHSRDLEWYFFSPLDRKYSSRSRTNRITPKGYWKTTGKDRPVQGGACVVGMKKTLVFHVGRAPRGKRSNWVMHEYRLESEQSAEAGISHDSYVVCRIFQKSGAGPQNGAKYGAPFLEEEWEEEATGGLLIPNAEENETNQTMQQNQNLEEQQRDTPEVVGGLLSKGCTGIPGNATISLDNDPCLATNMTDSIDEPVQQSCPTPLDDVNKRSLIDNTQSDTQLNKMDKHREFNEINEFISYPLRNWHDQDVDGVVSNSSLGEMFDINEFFDTTGADTNQSQLCAHREGNFYVQPTGLNPLADGYLSNQEYQDEKVFHDAPSNDLKFNLGNSVELGGSLYLSANNPSDLDVVDDLLVYFDATDDAIHYDIMGSCNNSSDQFNSVVQVHYDNCPTSNMMAQVAGADTVAGSSSSPSSSACSKPMGKHEEVRKSDADDKTIARRLQNMLGSISAPPAFAAECSGGLGKSFAQITATRSVCSVLSCSMEDSRATKLAARELIAANPVYVVMKVFRGSIYLSFLSLLSLTFCYKVIKTIFMAG